MAGISILLFNFLFCFILMSAFTGLILFIVSMVLFRKKKRAGNNVKKANKVTAIVLLAVSLICFLPLGISIVGIAIGSGMENAKEKKKIEAIENKVYVERDKWKKGFDYNGIHLVPVNILMNSENYHPDGEFQNLEKIGALVMEKSNDYYTFYQVKNDSGYPIYYVRVESFSGGVYYSRTFVEEKDYDGVLKFYDAPDFSVSALWKSAPENSHLRYNWKRLGLCLDGRQGEELAQLAHEVLDDVSDKRRVSDSWDDDYEGISFTMKSNDGVFSIDLSVYTKSEDMVVFLNNYRVEDGIVERHKEMLGLLVRDAQAELLEMTGEQ